MVLAVPEADGGGHLEAWEAADLLTYLSMYVARTADSEILGFWCTVHFCFAMHSSLLEKEGKDGGR